MALSVGVAKVGSGLTAQRSTHGTASVAPARANQTLAVTAPAGGLGNVTSGGQAAGGFGGAGQAGLNVNANNPYNYGSFTQANANLSNTTTPGGTTTGGGGGAVNPITAQANAIKSSITGLIGNIKGVYDALYGDVAGVAADKTNQIDQQYGNDVKSLTDQFNSQFPLIGQGYGARGTYDSSYRINAEKGAQDQFSNSAATLGQGHDQDLAKVGQYIATQQADFNNQKGGLDSIAAQIANSQNPDELTQLQNTLNERLRTLSASRAGNQTQASYLGQLNAVVPQSNRLSGVQSSLTNVLNSAVPAPIKLAIAGQLVNQAGLNGEDSKRLLADFQAQVGGVDDKNQIPA